MLSSTDEIDKEDVVYIYAAAAAAVASVVSDSVWPIDGSPPGSSVSGILQVRILEWGAISFSNAWKWSCAVVSDS